MPWHTMIATLGLLLAVELATDLVKKTPLWLLGQSMAAYQRLWKVRMFLRNTVYDEDKGNRFGRWRSNSSLFVTLLASKAGTEKLSNQVSVLNLLDSTTHNEQALLLLGEPGSGKTTSLQAFTCMQALRAYRRNFLVWFGLLLVASLLALVAPLLSLAWLVLFFVWEPLTYRTAIPIYLEARSDYSGGDVRKWLDSAIKDRIAGQPIYGSLRVVFVIDGVNEVPGQLYSPFVEGWRSFLVAPYRAAVIFSSRAGENPALRIGLREVFVVRPLDDSGVREFLRIYSRTDARRETLRDDHPNEFAHVQAVQTGFNELDNKRLLTEAGIGRNPYWLKMIVQSGLYTPNRGELFLRFAKTLIDREIEDKPEDRKRKPEWRVVPRLIEMNALACLALEMHAQGRVGFSGLAGWQHARTAVKRGLDDEPYTVDDVLGEAEVATLLTFQYQTSVEFSHQLVQEFFASYALRSEISWAKSVSHANDSWWWQTILLLGGLIASEGSPASYDKYVMQMVGDLPSDEQLFVAVGLLQCVDRPSERLVRDVMAPEILSAKLKGGSSAQTHTHPTCPAVAEHEHQSCSPRDPIRGYFVFEG